MLCEAGARTGKSFSLMHKADWTAREYPNSRQLFTRLTRESMNDTVLPDFEDEVLWPGHPAIWGDAKPRHRHEYRYPNGSIIALIGLNNINRILSSKWDRIYLFQGEELRAITVYMKVLTRLANFRTPYHQFTNDVNPDDEFHPINIRGDAYGCTNHNCGAFHEALTEDKRCTECEAPLHKLMKRIAYRHQDNAQFFHHGKCRDCGNNDEANLDRATCVACGSVRLGDWSEEGKEYMDTLNQLSGTTRRRLKDHEWCTAEGLIFVEYDSLVHQLERTTEDDDRHLRYEDGPKKGELVIHQYFGTFDWGYKDAACLCIWGVREPFLYRMFEVYFHLKQPKWWMDKVLWFHERYDLMRVEWSCERPEQAEEMNELLISDKTRRLEEGGCALVEQTKWKGKGVGIGCVKDHLKPIHGGRPLVYLVRDAHIFGIDRDLKKNGLPYSMEKEMPGYIYIREDEKLRTRIAKFDRERPDPSCEDHGMDNLQIACLFHEHGGDFTPEAKKTEIRPGTYAHVLDHQSVIDQFQEAS